MYVPFDEARRRVHALGLRNFADWSAYLTSSRRQRDIPCNPQDKYPEWAGWQDFLGDSYVPRKCKICRSYPDARIFAHTLGLDCRAAWETWVQRERGELPTDIPIDPRQYYGLRGCWKGWTDFLGAEREKNVKPRKKYILYEQAQGLARREGVRNSCSWRRWYESAPRATNIPSYPDKAYRKTGEWTSWKVFLGPSYGPSDDRFMRTYDKARKFAHSLHLQSQDEWRKWCTDKSLPCTIPRHPEQVCLQSTSALAKSRSCHLIRLHHY